MFLYSPHTLCPKLHPQFWYDDFSPGISVLSYDPGTSKWPHLSFCVHQLWVWKIGIITIWLVTMRHLRVCNIFLVYHPRTSFHLILHIFSFIKFIARSAPSFCYFSRLYGFSAPITFISSSCVKYLYISIIDRQPCIFINFLAVICVDVVPTAIWCMSCMSYWYFLFTVMVNSVPYLFPQISFRDVQLVFLRVIFLVLYLCSCSP